MVRNYTKPTLGITRWDYILLYYIEITRPPPIEVPQVHVCQIYNAVIHKHMKDRQPLLKLRDTTLC